MRKWLIALACALLIPVSALAQEGVWFSLESGFYDTEITVEILCDDPEADVYYTLNGSVPNEEDGFYYDEAFLFDDRTWEDNALSAEEGTCRNQYIPEENVVKGHVLRAVAIYPDGSRSAVASATYFVGVDRAGRYGDVPVISLMMDYYDLFDNDTGIYVLGKHFVEWDSQQTEPYEDWQIKGNFSQKGREWERPVTVQYLPADGTEGFTQDMGVRIKGGVSRSFNQKSLRLIAREEYGEKNITYPVLGKNTRADGAGLVDKYKSITLRNGGNDVESTRLRDPFIQRLASGLGFMTQASEPCVVFINGEYWGMYNITEEYSDNAVQNNYGIDNKNVIIIKNGRVEEGEDSDIEIWNEMFDFISLSDMTDPANYAQAAQMLDLPGFAQYVALQLYINNTDGIFQNNNWMLWRARETSDVPYGDGLWRILLFDTESSCDIWGDGRSFTKDNLTEVITDDGSVHEDRHMQKLFYALYQSEEFRKELVIALSDMRNVNFASARVVSTLEEMTPVYSMLMRDTFLRFGPEWVAKWNLDTHHAAKIDALQTYLRGRYDRYPYVVKKALGLEYPVEAVITANDYALGQIQVNRTLLPAGDFTGLYFMEYGVTVTAIPAEGRTFKGWEVSGAVLDDASALTAQVTFEKDFTLQAVFE